MNRDRALGAVHGLAVGDALGATTEFTCVDDAPAFPQLMTGPLRAVVGDGHAGLIPGQVTDDTQMAIVLADSLREHGGYDLAATARAYLRWSKVGFSLGRQTIEVMARLDDGEEPLAAGIRTWTASGRKWAANGSLMRAAPLGVYFWRTEQAGQLLDAALLDGAITHPDPRCLLACAAYTAAIACGVRGGSADMMLASARDALERAHKALLAAGHGQTPEEIDGAAVTLGADLDLAATTSPRVYGEDAGLHLYATMGFVRVAFRLAFWYLVNAPTFEAALIDVVNRGGDADTNGCIVGALLGARDGAGGIPEKWIATVMDAMPPAPWDDVYHPRRLVAVVDATPPRQVSIGPVQGHGRGR